MLLLLAACAAPTEPSPDRDTAEDSGAADSGVDSAADTDPTADTDTDIPPGPTPVAPHFSLEPCGTNEHLLEATDPGRDLDGDGMYDLLVSAPGNDHFGTDFGAVYVFLGADFAGALAPADAKATLYADVASDADMVGAWYDDLDGDGLPEVAAGDWFFPGARVLAGGALTSADALSGLTPHGTPYVDLDGDGIREVLVADPDHFNGRLQLLDGALALAGTEAVLAEVRGGKATWLGDPLVLVSDRDGDSLPEVATRLGQDLVVLSSVGLLANRVAVLQRISGLGYCACNAVEGELLTIADLDGDGADDLLSNNFELSFIGSRAGSVDAADLPALAMEPGWYSHLEAVGSDLDGDLVPEVWVILRQSGIGGARSVAISGADLAAGTATADAVVATITSDTVATARLAASPDGAVWIGERAGTPDPGALRRFQPAAGAAVDLTAAAGLLLGETVGRPDLAFDVYAWQTVWIDLDGDGADELVVERDEEGYVFSAAQVAAGGTLTICDASSSWKMSGVREIQNVELPGDLDGDGVDDALVVTRPRAEPTTVEILSAPAFHADPDARGRVVYLQDTSWPARHSPFADLDGDGIAEWVGGSGRTTGYGLIRGAAWAGTITPADMLDRVADADALHALADLDGDGSTEIAVFLPGTPGHVVILRGADVAAGSALTGADALALVAGGDRALAGSVVAIADLDGDAIAEVAVGTWDRATGVSEVLVFSGAELAAGGTHTRTDAIASLFGREIALHADTDGDGADELLVWTRTAAGATLRLYTSRDLRTSGHLGAGDAAWKITFDDPSAALLHSGPDLLGTGEAITVHWTEPDTDRSRISVVFGP